MKHEFKPSPKVSGVVRGRATISGSGRFIDTHKQIIDLINPDGETEQVTRGNARFLVREFGWKWVGGVCPRARGTVVLPNGEVIEEQLKDEVDGESSDIRARKETAAESDTQEGEIESGFQKTVDPATEALNEMRTEAEGLGIKVDKRWGKKKLQQKIEEAK